MGYFNFFIYLFIFLDEQLWSETLAVFISPPAKRSPLECTIFLTCPTASKQMLTDYKTKERRHYHGAVTVLGRRAIRPGCGSELEKGRLHTWLIKRTFADKAPAEQRWLGEVI